MAEWQYFHLEQERPDSPVPQSESQRKLLEMAVASKVAFLLAYYAEVYMAPVDNSDSFTEAEFTYEYLSIKPLVMDKDDEFKVEQIPITTSGPLAEKGVHVIEVVDEDDLPKNSITIFDPAVYTDRNLVVGPEEETIPLDELHELLDALTVLEIELRDIQDPNNPPFDTTAYPRKVIEPDFADIIQDF